MRSNSIAPVATLAAFSLAACENGHLSPIASPAAKGSSTTSATARMCVSAALSVSAESPYGAAKSKAKWDSREANSERAFETEVEELPIGTVLEFFVNGTRIGSGTANAFGEASLELSTHRRHTVRTSVSHAAFDAQTAAGVIIVSGVFAAN